MVRETFTGALSWILGVMLKKMKADNLTFPLLPPPQLNENLRVANTNLGLLVFQDLLPYFYKT